MPGPSGSGGPTATPTNTATPAPAAPSAYDATYAYDAISNLLSGGVTKRSQRTTGAD